MTQIIKPNQLTSILRLSRDDLYESLLNRVNKDLSDSAYVLLQGFKVRVNPIDARIINDEVADVFMEVCQALQKAGYTLVVSEFDPQIPSLSFIEVQVK